VFNLCHKFVPEGCDAKDNAIGYIINGDKCTPLTKRTDNATTTWQYVATDPAQPTKRLLEGVYVLKDKFLGLAQHRKYDMRLKQGVKVENFENLDQQRDFGKKKGVNILADNSSTGLDYDITFQLKCNPDAKKVQNLTGTLNGRTITISLSHEDACSFDVLSFWDRLGNFKYVFEGIIAAAGIFLCFFGIKLAKPTAGMIGFFGGAGCAYLFASMFLDISQDEQWYFWVEIGVCVAIGAVCCILIVIFHGVEYFVGGAALGFVLGNVLYDLFIYKWDNPAAVGYYVTVIVLAIIGALLALWLKDPLTVIFTSVVGSYIAIKMIGTMIGNYPDEASVVKRIQAGELDGMPHMVWVYLGIMVALGTAGVVIQFKFFFKKKDDSKKKNDDIYNSMM